MANPDPPHIASVSWPSTAAIGDKVTLTANTSSVKDGTTITFVISEYSGIPPAQGGSRQNEITTLTGTVQGDKAEVDWTVVLVPESSKTGGAPEYRFVAKLYDGQAGVASKLLELNIKVTITAVDIPNNKISYTIAPASLQSGTINVIVKGRDNQVLMQSTAGGGGNGTAQFDWSKFPQSPGTEFVATSLRVQWTTMGVTVEGEQAIHFTGYGVFRLTKFYTPRDSSFPAPDTTIPKDAACFSTASTVRVNNQWATTVSSNEGVGEFGGSLVLVRNCVKKDKNGKVTEHSHRMLTVEGGGPVGEGKYRSPLDVATSLAKHEGDERFAKHEQILLPSINSTIYSIDDTGNWGGGNNRFDKFMGRGGPDLGSGDFGSSYVVKLPKP